MSTSIKDLLDYNLVKKCNKCGFIKVISNFDFRTDIQKYRNSCKPCVYKQRKERESNNIEIIKEKRRIYINERLKTDVNFRLIKNTRERIRKALRGGSKSTSSREILGIDIESYKKWIEFQMTPEMNWSNIQIDHIKPISSFDVSKEDELLEAFNWRNTQPLLKEDNLRKGTKYNELDSQLEFTKADEFLKLNGETVSD